MKNRMYNNATMLKVLEEVDKAIEAISTPDLDGEELSELIECSLLGKIVNKDTKEPMKFSNEVLMTGLKNKLNQVVRNIELNTEDKMKNLRTKLSYVLYTLLACVFLIGCNHLEEGIVVGKHYEPMQQNLVFMPMVVCSGKTTTTELIPYYVTDNEDYVLHIKGTYKGEEIIEQVYTSKECYNRIQNGDIWTKTDYCSFSDDNNTKEKKI